MACTTSISKREKEIIIRPPRNNDPDILAPINNEFGDLDGDNETAETQDEWEELADKCEDLENRIHEYLDDESNAETKNPPIVKSPPAMTKEEWERHPVTHTPFVIACKR